MKKNARVIGIDIGGTKIHGVVLNSKNKVEKELKIMTEAKKGFLHVKERIFSVIDKLMDDRVRGIGIGIAGPLDYKQGIVFKCPNIPGCNDVHLKKIVEKKYKIPACIENDAKCFALAEFHHGAGKGTKHMIGMTIGTGIGSGIIFDGKLYRGRDNIAGEIGHMTIDYNGYDCTCGSTGCFEQYASGTAILKRTREYLKGPGKGEKTCLKTTGLNTRDIYYAAIDGDPVAVQMMKNAGSYLGVGLANLVNIINPEVIVLGGSAAINYDIFEKEMRKTMKKRALYPAYEIPIVHFKLQYPGTIGAALVVRE